MDVRHPAFGSGLDAIGMFDILEQLADDESALNYIYESLTTEGGVMITVPEYQWLWSATDDLACHKRRYSRKDLSAKLRKAGFEIVLITSFMTLLLPVMIAARFVTRLKKNHRTHSEFEISTFLNQLCYKICAIDRVLITSGFSLPFGGSLLAVGRKPI